ncbi:MAG: DNA topoisomerase VI subunit B [Candidatus Woesearchaeota archaeon]
MQTTLTGKKEIIAAEQFAKNQREISVAEFFTKNRHLLGFDNPRKALLTTIKEAVDNSLDACEDMRVLPEIKVEVKQLSEERFSVTVEDNGPGIVKAQVPRIFAKLLYGSKFHTLKCGRGQQGIGISASAMYGQLTTGKGIRIWSRISPKKPAHYFELHINTKLNEPEILKEEVVEWEKEHGTKIEIELEAKYQKGKQSIDEYLKQTAISNPHASISYRAPGEETVEFPRVTEELPVEPKEIKPHPYGVELGILMKMLSDTKYPTLQSFLQKEFSRVSPKIAKEICEKARLYERARPSRIARQEVDSLFQAIKNTKIMAPPTNCLVPIGQDLLLGGMKKEVDAEFYAAVTRSPSVYRGCPFQIEVGISFGGTLPADDLVRVIRYANRVPLLYQQSACAITKSIIQTAWRNYGLSQSRSSLPVGPAMVIVHIASVWVPFTSESKEAIASYPEIVKEIKLALQECGRQLASHIRKVKKAEHQEKRQKIFELYIHEVADSLCSLAQCDKEKLIKNLHKISTKRTGGIEHE